MRENWFVVQWWSMGTSLYLLVAVFVEKGYDKRVVRHGDVQNDAPRQKRRKPKTKNYSQAAQHQRVCRSVKCFVYSVDIVRMWEILLCEADTGRNTLIDIK